MIELLSSERCIDCYQCIRVCPTNVFDKDERQHAVIARQSDCQTCFICEVYCPADALFVSPMLAERQAITEHDVAASGLLGSYREIVGWGKGRRSTASQDRHHELAASLSGGEPRHYHSERNGTHE
ncbi:4Fe-4S dicluster domain-containing protein [Paenibacillus aurantiacus]|uniref:4Fe-4S dicluster domain-containing protein n=1 Tax=Paenibacillus aurantiacus TaxID=1936118 RepID=A0ABV5KW26_9BACL